MTSAAQNKDDSATYINISAESLEKSAALNFQHLGNVKKRHVSESNRKNAFKLWLNLRYN